MSQQRHFISIWLFIGVLLLIYGVLILGSGIYDLATGTVRQTVLAELHAPIWWGALLTVLGAVYTVAFRPR
jgi:Na+/phosphate symporter